jgi:competence protein ComEC
VFFIARWLWALPGTTVLRLPAPQFGAVCALLAATFYAALAGFVVPTQRALIMLTVAMAGVLLRRRFPPSQILAVAGLAVLVYDPLSVMAAGFWLSFAAVAVILFFMHGDRMHMPLAWKWGYIQWAIALGMLPLMLAMFQQLSLVAPLANMLAVPVFDLLLVPLTLLGALALGVAPDVAGLLFQLAAWLLHWLWQVLTWLAEPSFSQWTQPRAGMVGAGRRCRGRAAVARATRLAGALGGRGLVAAIVPGAAAAAGGGGGVVHAAGCRPGIVGGGAHP